MPISPTALLAHRVQTLHMCVSHVQKAAVPPVHPSLQEGDHVFKHSAVWGRANYRTVYQTVTDSQGGATERFKTGAPESQSTAVLAQPPTCATEHWCSWILTPVQHCCARLLQPVSWLITCCDPILVAPVPSTPRPRVSFGCPRALEVGLFLR